MSDAPRPTITLHLTGLDQMRLIAALNVWLHKAETEKVALGLIEDPTARAKSIANAQSEIDACTELRDRILATQYDAEDVHAPSAASSYSPIKGTSND